jgi:hypothetical protein
MLTELCVDMALLSDDLTADTCGTTRFQSFLRMSLSGSATSNFCRYLIKSRVSHLRQISNNRLTSLEGDLFRNLAQLKQLFVALLLLH